MHGTGVTEYAVLGFLYSERHERYYLVDARSTKDHRIAG